TGPLARSGERERRGRELIGVEPERAVIVRDVFERAAVGLDQRIELSWRGLQIHNRNGGVLDLGRGSDVDDVRVDELYLLADSHLFWRERLPRHLNHCAVVITDVVEERLFAPERLQLRLPHFAPQRARLLLVEQDQVE